MNLVLQYILKRTVGSFLVFLHMCLLSFSFVDYFISLTGFFFSPSVLFSLQFSEIVPNVLPRHSQTLWERRVVLSRFRYEVGWAVSQTALQLQERWRPPPDLCLAEHVALH